MSEVYFLVQKPSCCLAFGHLIKYHSIIKFILPEMSDWGEQLCPKGQVQQFDNIICDSYIAAIKGAADGLGVALGIFPTLNEWVNTEKLILPFLQQIETDKGFWFVYPKKDSSNGTIEDEKYQGLYQWVKDIFAAIPPLEEKK